MATVSLNFIKEEARSAASAAAEGVTVTVTMSGGDRWDTGGGTKDRSFEIELKG